MVQVFLSLVTVIWIVGVGRFSQTKLFLQLLKEDVLERDIAKQAIKAPKQKKDHKHSASLEKCPDCSSPLVKKNGKYGPFLGCSTWPTCKYTRNIELKTPKQSE